MLAETAAEIEFRYRCMDLYFLVAREFFSWYFDDPLTPSGGAPTHSSATDIEDILRETEPIVAHLLCAAFAHSDRFGMPRRRPQCGSADPHASRDILLVNTKLINPEDEGGTVFIELAWIS